MQTHGYLREPDWKEHITPGQTTTEEVRAQLGSPSSQSSFGQDTWYYITSKQETFGFFRPDTRDQDVTRIVFDDNGVVTALDQYTLNNARDITIADKTTPTEGHEMGFMEQMFGNIGRFNAPGTTPGSAGNSGRIPGQGGPGR